MRYPSPSIATLSQLYLDALADGRGAWIASRSDALAGRISLGQRGYRCRGGRAVRSLTDAALTWARSASFPRGAW